MTYPKALTNNKVRERIDDYVIPLLPGTIIKNEDMIPLVSPSFRYGITARSIGRLLRERSDVIRVKAGVWRKL